MRRRPYDSTPSLSHARSYLCSVRTMYRILDANQEVRERRNQRRHPVYQKPELLARGPNQVWSWDITKLKGPRKEELLSIGVEKHQAAFSSGTWLTGTPLTYLAPW